MASARDILSLLKSLIEKYKDFVIQNAELLGRCESTARILAYVVPGGSATVSELLSSLVSIVVMINDAILRSAANINLNLAVPERYLTTCLAVLEQVEVFLEIASIGTGGDTLKWFIVACINIFKAVIQFLLLYKYRCGIQCSPAIPFLKRNQFLMKRLTNKADSPNTEATCFVDWSLNMLLSIEHHLVHMLGDKNKNRKVTFMDEQAAEIAQTYTLKSSGRTMRTLSASTHGGVLGGGDCKMKPDINEPLTPTPLTDQQMFAESLRIARPLVHLLSMYLFGQSSWKPFLVACGMDVSSVWLMGDTTTMNTHEQEEIKRRSFLLLLYLLRSPFYDNYSRRRVMLLLSFLAYKVPGVRLAIRPLLDYLPVWQKIYGYVWMT